MKTLTEKEEFSILKRLVVDWKAAIADGAIAKRVLFRASGFKTEQVHQCVGALLLNNGDVHLAVRDLGIRPAPWLPKFIKWCDKIRGGAK